MRLSCLDSRPQPVRQVRLLCAVPSQGRVVGQAVPVSDRGKAVQVDIRLTLG